MWSIRSSTRAPGSPGARSRRAISYPGYGSLSYFFFFSSRRRHTRSDRDWSSDVCSSDLVAREMETIPLYIDETGGLSIAQLAARARRLKRQRGLDVLVIDYIQLLQGSRDRKSVV